MKNKVVIFTQNNARILVNPPDLDKFADKPNTFVNPDLSLVTGVEPHFWKLLPATEPLKINEAERLRNEIDELLTLSENESEQTRYYKTLRDELDTKIKDSAKAFDLISKLINKANGIDREDITTQLYDQLIHHGKDPSIQKENLIFKHMISQWEMGSIIPMDDDERKVRESHVRKHGAINVLNAQITHRFNYKWALYTTLVFALILVVVTFLR